MSHQIKRCADAEPHGAHVWTTVTESHACPGTAAPAYLPSSATTEARNVLVTWLDFEAEERATGSRDFGRGFAAAVRALSEAPVQCSCCAIPRKPVGETVPCPLCGALWRISHNGATWVPGGTPVPMSRKGSDHA